MKYRITFIISLLICLLLVINISAESVSDNPKILISDYVDNLKVGDTYCIHFKGEKIRQLNHCLVQLHYNPDVLKVSEIINTYQQCDYTSFISETDLIGILQFEVTYHPEGPFYCNCDGGGISHNIIFDVIGAGDTGLYIEIIDDSCKNDQSTIIDISTLEKTISIGSESSNAPTNEPTETPSPTEEIKETETPLLPTEIIKETPIPTNNMLFLGDLNKDDIVDASDALLVLKHAAKLELLSTERLSVADVNADEVITAEDALEILKIAAKIK